jgi:hypothetical protein
MYSSRAALALLAQLEPTHSGQYNNGLGQSRSCMYTVVSYADRNSRFIRVYKEEFSK